MSQPDKNTKFKYEQLDVQEIIAPAELKSIVDSTTEFWKYGLYVNLYPSFIQN